MTIAASGSSWTVRPLRPRDRQQALAFLDREHELNIYLIARMHEYGSDGLGPIVAVFRHDGQIAAVATTTANLACAVDPDIGDEDLDRACALIAESIIDRSSYLRAIISPSRVVASLWDRLESHFSPPTVVRLRQPVYVLDQMDDPPDLEKVRYARTDDLELLVPACSTMHLEEIGIDPLTRDAFGYHQRVRDLVVNHRSFVWMDEDGIAFKCELSAETADAVQLMGVWTRPSLRRQGYALRGMREVCGHILRQGRTVSLFVNDFNRPARDLYERLGFRQIGENRALIW